MKRASNFLAFTAAMLGSAATACAQDSGHGVFDGSFFARDAAPAAAKGTQGFSNFIGFMSDPTQSIDPRSLSQIYPIFLNNSISTSPILPDGNIQLYGAGVSVALTDRLSLGLSQGGYAVGQFSGPNGSRSGWMNMGGEVQYTLIADVAEQFILTGGLRFVVPTGEQDVFQGHGPVQLAPYVTVGKEYCDFHILATTGYQFPVSGADERLDVFYVNFHLDRRVCGWIYPLVELNSSFVTSDFNGAVQVRDHYFDFSNFESTGTVVALAVGANFVLSPNRLEVGAVYQTPLYTQRNFDFNAVLVKMVIRF